MLSVLAACPLAWLTSQAACLRFTADSSLAQSIITPFHVLACTPAQVSILLMSSLTTCCSFSCCCSPSTFPVAHSAGTHMWQLQESRSTHMPQVLEILGSSGSSGVLGWPLASRPGRQLGHA